jgi:hypothetical protein
MTAARVERRAVGNPVTTRLEAGVGNCFPGLEFDIRNLDRRFYPHLSFDILRTSLILAASDPDAAKNAGLAAAEVQKYQDLRDDLISLPGSWAFTITGLSGDFLGYGPLTLDLVASPLQPADSATRPSDDWAAIRLLRPGTTVTITLSLTRTVSTDPTPTPTIKSSVPLTFSGPRAAYLDADGALAAMFEAGELTQSLCSPWTHDFRDCNCGYWASNHPDIVQPALPEGVAADDPGWSPWVQWQRFNRDTATPPSAADASGGSLREIDYFEINDRWQSLDIVLDGREVRGAYAASAHTPAPLPAAELERHLRYAAGVELGVMLEYLSAVFSLNTLATDAVTRADALAAQAELLRVAIGEMKHLREVNVILRTLHIQSGSGAAFVPALGAATLLPGGTRGDGSAVPQRPIRFRRLEKSVMQEFVDIEAPSLTVDGVYTRILDTFVASGQEELSAVVGSIRADGAEHYQTFRLIQEWLDRHADQADYLLTLSDPPATNAQHLALQTRYVNVLTLLASGYANGPVTGGADIRSARAAMLGATGVRQACEDVAAAGFLVKFDTPSDPRFTPVAPP